MGWNGRGCGRDLAGETEDMLMRWQWGRGAFIRMRGGAVVGAWSLSRPLPLMSGMLIQLSIDGNRSCRKSLCSSGRHWRGIFYVGRRRPLLSPPYDGRVVIVVVESDGRLHHGPPLGEVGGRGADRTAQLEGGQVVGAVSVGAGRRGGGEAHELPVDPLRAAIASVVGRGGGGEGVLGGLASDLGADVVHAGGQVVEVVRVVAVVRGGGGARRTGPHGLEQHHCHFLGTRTQSAVENSDKNATFDLFKFSDKRHLFLALILKMEEIFVGGVYLLNMSNYQKSNIFR